jgi:membrane-bound lytic murein transglycosylase B
LGFLVLGALLLPVGNAAASSQDRPTSPQRYAQRIRSDERAIAEARATADALRAHPALAGTVGKAGLQSAQEDAELRFRQAVRGEQDDIRLLAADPEVIDAVGAQLASPARENVLDSIRAMQALWRLAGIEAPSLIQRHRTRRHDSSVPVGTLVAYYREAGARHGVDWSYLAAINFVESDFGRVSAPSSAGALGPMQFMPETWNAYGEGDVWNPHDAIAGAARYLAANGAPADMRRALWHYNHDYDYVEAVTRYATAIRRDPDWLTRYYYWNTHD